MNEILKITSKAIPNAQQPQLPLPAADLDSQPTIAYPPEFWISIPTGQQQRLIEEFEANDLEYRIYEIVDSYLSESKAVCRSWKPYPDTAEILLEICNRLSIDGYIVSHGGLTSVDANGELTAYICFD